jgi:hypothetical protein
MLGGVASMRGQWVARYRGRVVARHPDRRLLAELMAAEGLGHLVSYVGPRGRPNRAGRSRPGRRCHPSHRPGMAPSGGEHGSSA